MFWTYLHTYSIDVLYIGTGLGAYQIGLAMVLSAVERYRW